MSDLTFELCTDSVRGSMIDWESALVEHRRWLRTVVVARVKELQAVDEVMQEIACAVFRKRPSLGDASKVGPWLYRVAVVQSIRYRRGQARRRRGLAQYARQCTENGNGRESLSPLRLLLAQERREIVDQAIRRLPGRDAELLLLKYAEHWSYRQLALYLDISESAVDGRLQRARQRLRSELASHDSCKGPQ